MVHKMVRYKVRKDQLDSVKAAVAEFVREVHDNEPGNSYRAFELAQQSGSFVHFMSFADSEAEKRHQQAAYTARFVEKLYANCDEKPAFEDLAPIL